MGRIKGSINKSTENRNLTSSLSSEERIKLLANLIIDKILDDQKNGAVILNNIKQELHIKDLAEVVNG